MDPIQRRWYLLPSPLLGPSSWQGVADELQRQNQVVVVADPPMTTTDDIDHISPWIANILSPDVPDDGLDVVVVGHSAACPRMPYAADRLLAHGWNVTSMICVDGRFPDGRSFTESEPMFAEMLDGLVRPDDYLPRGPAGGARSSRGSSSTRR